MSSGTSYGGGGFGGSILGDITGVQQHAQHHSSGHGDESLFGNALAMLQAKESNLANEDVDEEHMVKAHKSYFGSGGEGGNATSGGIGAASAMQALKMFNGGTSEGGESSQQEFIGMAMGQAAKLFEQQQSAGNVAEGESKQSAVQQAGEAALKMYMKSEMGNNSSGGGGLMSLASKFM
ncbi:uncharacterized protein LTR77_003963 [Saxophila tyrrhenica]|uniref:DUF7721 domain-containing protein n=1 Tax=Saxophila tyrrhenica TaxID=1690608 RepID=A0AAV9PFL5_9PEZI|nr:hypothetical protein LTR77_003963 [Saxophila tyrrhenica]